jgi:hypothetical protein
MRKVCLIVLGILFAFATASYAAGGTVNDISSEKWLDHLAQMQVMRQQILRLVTKPTPTVRDKEMLNALQKSFNEKKNEWDSYIEDVALGLTEQKEVKQTYCSSCGKRLCDCGKGVICKKCGKRICTCAKAHKYEHKHNKKNLAPKTRKPYHRYDKRPRTKFKKEYHRYNKTDRSCVSDCETHKTVSCTTDSKGGTECTTTTTISCGAYKQTKKHFKKSRKAYQKGHDCGSCPSKKSVCATSCETTVACNGGIDCPSCPNYRTSRCCKVSGKCSSGHDCQHKHEVKRTHKDGECPICREYRLMKINRKCSRCAG